MRAGRFMDDDYILRFGFIKASRNSDNPHGLPVGFATTPGQNLPGVTYSSEAVGFTCAACHTGQLTYGGKRYIVDGGPAPTDLGQLVKALGAALGQTAIAAKLPFLNGRFERFAKTVLGDNFSNQREVELRDELDAVVAVLAAQQNDVDVVEGFSRLDALNRIGNQVFAIDSRRPQNYAAINAPVNYPHLWTSAWFEWVQDDGSIMGPLIRNTGEAIGVNAEMALTAPVGEGRFGSSVPIPNLAWIEEALAGPPPLPAKSFQGLRAPRWPNTFPKIDMERAKEGRALYNNHCQRCHLPPLDSEEIWSQFAQFDYYDQAGQLRRTRDSLLKINTIPLSRIGTDPGQANVLVSADRRHCRQCRRATQIRTPRAWGWMQPFASASSRSRNQRNGWFPDASGSRGPGEADRSLGNRPGHRQSNAVVRQSPGRPRTRSQRRLVRAEPHVRGAKIPLSGGPPELHKGRGRLQGAATQRRVGDRTVPAQRVGTPRFTTC